MDPDARRVGHVRGPRLAIAELVGAEDVGAVELVRDVVDPRAARRLQPARQRRVAHADAQPRLQPNQQLDRRAVGAAVGHAARALGAADAHLGDADERQHEQQHHEQLHLHPADARAAPVARDQRHREQDGTHEAEADGAPLAVRELLLEVKVRVAGEQDEAVAEDRLRHRNRQDRQRDEPAQRAADVERDAAPPCGRAGVLPQDLGLARELRQALHANLLQPLPDRRQLRQEREQRAQHEGPISWALRQVPLEKGVELGVDDRGRDVGRALLGGVEYGVHAVPAPRTLPTSASGAPAGVRTALFFPWHGEAVDPGLWRQADAQRETRGAKGAHLGLAARPCQQLASSSRAVLWVSVVGAPLVPSHMAAWPASSAAWSAQAMEERARPRM